MMARCKLFFCLLLCSATGMLCAQPPVPTSGYDFLTGDIQAIQDDDFLNPGMPTVEQGHALFHQVPDDGPACAHCHGEDGAKLEPVNIAAYPRFQQKYQQVMTLQERIHACWTDHQDRFPVLYDDPQLIRLETYVRYLARGTAIQVVVPEEGRALYEKGKALYHQRLGQMNMTCAHCHEQYQGVYLRGRKLTQGQSNGFPLYRFDSDRVTSLHRRLNECFIELRAEPYQTGSEEYRALEYYMGVKSNGLEIETPAVRF